MTAAPELPVPPSPTRRTRCQCAHCCSSWHRHLAILPYARAVVGCQLDFAGQQTTRNREPLRVQFRWAHTAKDAQRQNIPLCAGVDLDLQCSRHVRLVCQGDTQGGEHFVSRVRNIHDIEGERIK